MLKKYIRICRFNEERNEKKKLISQLGRRWLIFWGLVFIERTRVLDISPFALTKPAIATQGKKTNV